MLGNMFGSYMPHKNLIIYMFHSFPNIFFSETEVEANPYCSFLEPHVERIEKEETTQDYDNIFKLF